ncbi:MAG: dienelactone hydrolase [Cyanobacteria bacterium PR.3.49]|nr:dienelactone hydrolase [Cyanobacteria bacterium PR.3.49]
MKLLLVAILLSSVMCAHPAICASETNVKYQEWKDTTRERNIPVKLYLPAQVTRPLPVVIFSHGLGGSREAAEYLGNYWAEHGYIGVFIQHPGSDESFWKPGFNLRTMDRNQLMGKFRRTVADPVHAVNRGNDIHFVLDQLEKINTSDPELRGKLDLNEIAIAGHSYGSWTALTASGQRFFSKSNQGISSGDRRIKAAIYLSPTPPRAGQDPAQVFGSISVPGIHFTGTLDSSPVNNTKAEERRIAFDNISKSDQYLVTLNGADHGVFGGRKRLMSKPDDEKFQEITQRLSTAFLDAYLKHDQKAKDWMLQSARAYIGGTGVYESKRAL